MANGFGFNKDAGFSTLAGSILEGKRRGDRKQFQRAVLASLFFNGITAATARNKQNMVDNVEEIKEDYSEIFKNNEELYNNPINAQNRAEYQSYLADKDGYVNRKAAQLFNDDPNIVKELGVNAYTMLNKDTLDPDSYQKAIQVLEAFKLKAEDDIKRKGLNPAVNLPTFTQFNEKASQALKAALAEATDDPTKQSLIKKAFNKIFGTASDGTKRFGLAEQAELIEASKNTKRAMEAQTTNVNSYLTIQEQEDAQLDTTSIQNKNANERIEVYAGTDIPTTFDFQTKKEVLKLNKDNFIKKVNTKGYLLTEEDINKAVEFNYPIPGMPGLQNLLLSDRDELLDIVKKVKTANENGLASWNEGVLNEGERRIWSIATNTDLNARQNSDIQLQLNTKKLKEKISVDPNDIEKVLKENTELRERTKSFIQAKIDSNPQLDFIYNEEMSSTAQDNFTRHVVEGALLLQQKQGSSYADALEQSFDIQKTGFYKYRDETGLLKEIFTLSLASDDTYRHEYVDLNAIAHMKEEIETRADADLAAYYMNKYRYIQNLPDKDNKPGLFIPAPLGRTIVENDYTFTVTNVGSSDNPQLKWTVEYTGN